MSQQDKTIGNLLDLNGEHFVVDEQLGLWVKFEAKRVKATEHRAHGIRYSLTLHDRTNKRILGFDNAHAIEYGKKNHVKAKRIFDHWHRDANDEGRPYDYKNAGKLVEDFWKEVDRVINIQGGKL